MPFLSTLEDTSDTFQHERVPTLDQVIALCKEKGLLMMIEIKPQPNLWQCCTSTVHSILSHGVQDDVYIASFSPIALAFVRYLTNQVCTGYLFTASATQLLRHEFSRQKVPIPWVIRFNPIASILDAIIRWFGKPSTLHLLGHSIAAIDYRFLSPYQTFLYKSARITLLSWTVNDYLTQRYLYEKLNVSVISDFPMLEVSNMPRAASQ